MVMYNIEYFLVQLCCIVYSIVYCRNIEYSTVQYSIV